MRITKIHLLFMTGIVLGGIAGYLYYHFVGCYDGTCSITSKPLNSTLYGALMGGLFVNLFNSKKVKTTSNENINE